MAKIFIILKSFTASNINMIKPSRQSRTHETKRIYTVFNS